jgi:hypothetical protein
MTKLLIEKELEEMNRRANVGAEDDCSEESQMEAAEEAADTLGETDDIAGASSPAPEVTGAPAAKKRGRPRKDPNAPRVPNTKRKLSKPVKAPAPAPKRRGRPPKSEQLRPKDAKASANLNAKSLKKFSDFKKAAAKKLGRPRKDAAPKVSSVREAGSPDATMTVLTLLSNGFTFAGLRAGIDAAEKLVKNAK